MIPKMNRLAKHDEYLLIMQDGARAYISKLTLEMLKDKKQLQFLRHNHGPTNIPDLNPAEFEI